MYIEERGKRREEASAYLFFLLILILFPFGLFAQSAGTAPIAETIPVAEAEVAYGDIILYDSESGLFRLSAGINDPRAFGVVVEDPTLLLETDSSLVPVVESGRVLVNITLENGLIHMGDAITTSSTPGKGMRAGEEYENIIGFAVESFDEGAGVVEINDEGTEVTLGTILVEVGGKRVSAAEVVPEKVEEEPGFDPNTGKVIARFGFAAVVALASIGLTFVAFLSTLRQSVISVGRNPLAKSSIRSMVILNIVLALVVTTIGIFFAISLLVVPL